LPTLPVRAEPPPAGDLRQWLLKPLRGSGGLGIRRYTGQRFDPRTHYLQEYEYGFAFGAVFLGLAEGYSIPLGISRLIHPNWLHAAGFHYCGNILPHQLVTANLHAIGDALTDAFALRGLFGVDLVYHLGTSDYRVLEVNPRYTASVELLERAYGASLLALHRAVFERRAVAWQQPPAPPALVGKAILYARDRLDFPGDGPWSQASPAAAGEADYADIPHPGQVIPRCAPVMTLFATGPTEVACLETLRQKAAALDCRLYG
jgi:predicted ATP-grasp superfamily ATP-dependent carboligase